MYKRQTCIRTHVQRATTSNPPYTQLLTPFELLGALTPDEIRAVGLHAEQRPAVKRGTLWYLNPQVFGPGIGCDDPFVRCRREAGLAPSDQGGVYVRGLAPLQHAQPVLPPALGLSSTLFNNVLAEEGEGDEAAEEDEADDADDGDAGDKYEGVLGFDEEDTGEDTADDTDADGADDLDNEEMDRLRVKTRTGSTSSDGSAHEREQAAAEAHRAQAQQEAEEERRKRQERTRPEPERRRSSEERLALIDAVEPPRPERRRQRDVVRDEELLQEELGRPEDEAHLVLQSPANLSDTVSSTGSEASHASSSAHRPGLSDGPGSSVHDEGSDVQGNAELRRYGDPFFDLVAQTPCGRMMLAVDWSATSLGDIRSWGGELRSHVMAMLASPFSTAIWYGADNVLLYNDAYARLLGPSKHPAVLGKSGAEGWSELWDVLGPLAGQVFSGKTLSFSDHCNCIMRNGALEETCAFPTLTLLRPRSPLLSTGVTG